jgi:hypothetical protein
MGDVFATRTPAEDAVVAIDEAFQQSAYINK